MRTDNLNPLRVLFFAWLALCTSSLAEVVREDRRYLRDGKVVHHGGAK